MVDKVSAAAFKTGLRGELISPADADYEAAHYVYNGVIDKHPQLIARCADAAARVHSVEALGIEVAI